MTDKYNVSNDDQQKILDARDFGYETANILNKALKEISNNASNESVDVQEDWQWKLKFITQTFHSSKKSAQKSIVNIGKYMQWLSRQSGREDEILDVINNAVKAHCRKAFAQEVTEVLEKHYQEYTGSVFVPYVKGETDKMKTKNAELLDVHSKKMVNYITDLNKVLEGDKVSYQPKHSIEDLTDAVQTA